MLCTNTQKLSPSSLVTLVEASWRALLDPNVHLVHGAPQKKEKKEEKGVV